MNDQVVALVSGGMDSVVMAYALANEHRLARLVAVDYGQRHRREMTCARLTAVRLGVPLAVLDLHFMAKLLPGSALTDPSMTPPPARYDDPVQRATIVPNRNMILLSLAAGVALAHNLDGVAIGAHAGDYAIYPDCRTAFFEAFAEAVRVGDGGRPDFKVETPFIGIDKGAIARLGLALGVPFGETWTCYMGSERPCGECGSCTERAEAFEQAGVPDPLLVGAT
jgi:7-cyano-7-deazaguanine synthase